MPLEISEIGVHLAVGSGPGPSGDANGGPAPGGDHDDDQPAMTEAHVRQIVESCVTEVLRNLRMREER